MLRVENDGHISLSFQTKERMFTKYFFQALCLALGFHLSGLLLFHIKPLNVTQSIWIFPPVNVLAEMPLENELSSITSSFFEQERGIPLPKYSEPRLPILSFYAKGPDVSREFLFRLPDLVSFVQIESFSREENFPILQEKYRDVKISLSGQLAEATLIENPTSSILPLLQKSSVEGFFSLHYSVLVDVKTGKIFWYEAQHENQDSRLVKIVEEVLKDLHFSTQETSFALSGNIELKIIL